MMTVDTYLCSALRCSVRNHCITLGWSPSSVSQVYIHLLEALPLVRKLSSNIAGSNDQREIRIRQLYRFHQNDGKTRVAARLE